MFFCLKCGLKNTDDGQVEINIPEGKTVRTRGVVGLDLTGEDLAEYFEEEENKMNEWEVEEALKESLTQHFEKEAESTEEYIDVEEEVNTRVQEWFWERQEAYMRARKEYNNNRPNATLKEIERYADSVARKVDKKYLKKYRFDNVKAAKSTPTDPVQEWLAPIKQKFLEARKAGASMAELKQMLLTMHPNTKALAKAFANNILAGFAGESEEVDAANPWGCNDHQHKCPQKGTTREPKLKTKPRLFRVDPDAPIHKQKVHLAEAIEKAAHDGVHLEAVITRPEFGELIIDCGKPGKTEAKRNREQKAENDKAAKEGRERKIISSGGNGAIHAMEGRHHVNPFDIAEAIIEGKVTQDANHASRINLETEKTKVTLEREIRQGSKKISKTRAKLHTASKI